MDGVGRKIAKAMQNLNDGDFVGALEQVLIAIDATAKKSAPLEKQNNIRFKNFIKDNMQLIWATAYNMNFPAVNLAIDHPQLKKNASGAVPFEEILYILRCEMLHEAEVIINLDFCDAPRIATDGTKLTLGKRFIIGLILAVVLSPFNVNQKINKPCVLDNLDIDQLWGKKAAFVKQYMKAP